jgi:hypothetical protein
LKVVTCRFTYVAQQRAAELLVKHRDAMLRLGIRTLEPAVEVT